MFQENSLIQYLLCPLLSTLSQLMYAVAQYTVYCHELSSQTGLYLASVHNLIRRVSGNISSHFIINLMRSTQLRLIPFSTCTLKNVSHSYLHASLNAFTFTQHIKRFPKSKYPCGLYFFHEYDFKGMDRFYSYVFNDIIPLFGHTNKLNHPPKTRELFSLSDNCIQSLSFFSTSLSKTPSILVSPSQ